MMYENPRAPQFESRWPNPIACSPCGPFQRITATPVRVQDVVPMYGETTKCTVTSPVPAVSMMSTPPLADAVQAQLVPWVE
jgi:hypothetical protein